MELFYKEYGTSGAELIVLHGLLGSGRNWHAVCSSLAEKSRIIVPDMRNHGRSPHSSKHHIADMVSDVLDLQNRHNMSKSFILGHSMGGLVAMDFAFHVPNRTRGVIVVDISPRPHRGAVAFVLDAMAALELSEMRSKNEIDEALAISISNPLVRQFVMTNVMSDGGHFKWRANVPVLKAFLLESQAYEPAVGSVFEGPALFIHGGRSDYVRDEDFELIRHHFPQARIEKVADVGHWVHHEAPDAILSLVNAFIEGVEKQG